MLGLIKRILSGIKKHDSVQESNLKTKLQHPHLITGQSKILKLLNEIEQETPLCTISFDRIGEQFTTTILEIQANKGLIIIDELSPKHGNEFIKKKRSLNISARFNNIDLNFNLSGFTTGIASGIIYYKAKLPQKIYYPQKRATHRISTHTNAIAFQGLSRKKLVITGNLVDISHGGIGIVLPDLSLDLLRGEKLTNCQITLPDNFDEITFDLSIRFAKSIRSNTKIKFGGYFENISSADQTKLQQFIDLLETENIRNL